MNSNLIPFDTMPPERHRELSRRGGVASGKKRRKKAAIQKLLKDIWERELIISGWIDDLTDYRQYLRQREARAKRKSSKENEAR